MKYLALACVATGQALFLAAMYIECGIAPALLVAGVFLIADGAAIAVSADVRRIQ